MLMGCVHPPCTLPKDKGAPAQSLGSARETSLHPVLWGLCPPLQSSALCILLFHLSVSLSVSELLTDFNKYIIARRIYSNVKQKLLKLWVGIRSCQREFSWVERGISLAKILNSLRVPFLPPPPATCCCCLLKRYLCSLTKVFSAQSHIHSLVVRHQSPSHDPWWKAFHLPFKSCLQVQAVVWPSVTCWIRGDLLKRDRIRSLLKSTRGDYCSYW